MKNLNKYSLVIIVLLYSVLAKGQAAANDVPQIKTELPTVVPPSPTVAALMKFEEVPVSTYTGVPDISIPLFSDVGNHGLAFNLSLNYSPSSIKKDEKAGYTGLGWSLFAGGTISRTIRGIPDEGYYLPYSTTLNTGSRRKIGIYHNYGDMEYDNNNFYDVLLNIGDDTNYVTNYPDNQIVDRFLFEANEKQTYDTKHDLYQFNFMGYTGRFIIEKKPNGSYEVSRLDKSNLIINYNAADKTFKIRDTKGFLYVFDVKDLSTSSYFTSSQDISQNPDSTLSGGESYADVESAFHLSKVYFNNELVLEFIYRDGYVRESQTVFNQTRNIPMEPSLNSLLSFAHTRTNPAEVIAGVLPLNVTNKNDVLIKTKKIEQIRLVGKAIIDFELEFPNTNPAMNQSEASSNLHKIIIRDWNPLYENTHIVKEYGLNYFFLHKMFLKEITEGIGTNQILKYQLKYKDLNVDLSTLNTDYWGYYKAEDTYCESLETRNRETDKNYCSKDVLKQIIYPTKGSVVFDFEPNTYSYIGATAIPETSSENDLQDSFSDNPDNWGATHPFVENNILFSSTNGQADVESLGYFSTDKRLIFNSTIANNESLAGHLRLIKKDNASPPHFYTVVYLGATCPQEVVLKAGYEYKIEFKWDTTTAIGEIGENPINENPPSNGTGNATVTIDEISNSTSINKWLYGGGIRIKNIYYTDGEALEVEQQNYPDTFSKKISYNYNFFNTERSSGSLVYPKPVLEYEMYRKFDQMVGNHSAFNSLDDIKYNVVSTTNNLSFISTKGSDVGYRNVTVTESGNGRTEYEYLSPIDFPEEITASNVTYPFAPTSNLDYKRGHLIDERKYDHLGRILTENHKSYSFVNELKTTGITTYYTSNGCPYAGRYFKYDDYYQGVIDTDNDPCTYPQICGNLLNWNARHCGEFVSEFVNYILFKEAYGWAKLDTVTSWEYFYDESGNQSNIQKVIAYTYNPLNMQLSEKLITYYAGNTERTKIYYPIDSECDSEPFKNALVDNNMIETPLKIENFKNGAKISEQKTIYRDWGSNLLLPKLIQTSKGNSALETRVRYTQYDEWGHPIQLEQEDGTFISYIWGYNNSQPIAKIENTEYVAISPNLIQDAQNESNAPTATAASVEAKLQLIRAALPEAMVTTYTYIPLVGVSSVTDPKGNTTTYSYDSFGRLSGVIDAKENRLSTNEYHYKN